MTRKTAAGWHVYKDAGELLAELDLTSEDMDRAQDVTDDHIRAWHLARVRAEQDRSQEDVALAMGVTQPSVSAIERGEMDAVTPVGSASLCSCPGWKTSSRRGLR